MRAKINLIALFLVFWMSSLQGQDKTKHNMNFLNENTWAISPQHSAIARLAKLKAESGDLKGLFALMDEAQEDSENPEMQEDKGVAVVTMRGVLSKNGENCTTSMRKIQRHLLEAQEMASSVVLIADTPGGTVRGSAELAYTIKNLKIPTVGYIDGLCCSAGYHQIAQTQYIVANALERSHIGGIGVFGVHIDESEKNEKEGIKVTYIYAGKHKIEGNSDMPLSEEFATEYQAEVTEAYQDFLNAIGHRNIQANALTGKTYHYPKALDLGFIDELGSFETAVNKARMLAASQRMANI